MEDDKSLQSICYNRGSLRLLDQVSLSLSLRKINVKDFLLVNNASVLSSVFCFRFRWDRRKKKTRALWLEIIMEFLNYVKREQKR